MNALAHARTLLIRAASLAITVPETEVVPAEQGIRGLGEAWSPLVDDPLVAKLTSLGLSEATAWMVLACAAVEAFPEAAVAASLLVEDQRIHVLTPGAWARIEVSVFDETYGEAVARALDGRAHRLGIVSRSSIVAGRGHSSDGLTIAEDDLVAVLRDEVALAPRGLRYRRIAPAEGIGFDPPLVAGLARLLERHGTVVLRSPTRRAARQLALDVASHQRRDLVLWSGSPLPGRADVDRLPDGLAVADLIDVAPADLPGALELAARRPSTLALVDRSAETEDWSALDVPRLGHREAVRIWAAAGRGSDSDRLARRFRLDGEEVRGAVREASDLAVVRGDGDSDVDTALVTDRVLAQGARRMGATVQRVESDARLGDLVVPREIERQLHEMVAWYGATTAVWSELGMVDRGGEGRGLTALFSGHPGTGKTLAAKCIANELGLNLYRIDLAKVVSKYIGETEKALSKVFDEAEAGHGVLLFDEADALFGKRTEVKDAHDRYANIEVGFLLQRLEAFEGVTILTTNLRSNLDSAFVRRFKFLLDFPVPSEAQRAVLWERALPPVEHRDAELALAPFVSRFRLTGGDIRNIGVAAAHLAAAEGAPLSAVHLVRATYRELEKNGRSHAPADFGPLAPLLEAGGAS